MHREQAETATNGLFSSRTLFSWSCRGRPSRTLAFTRARAPAHPAHPRRNENRAMHREQAETATNALFSSHSLFW
jgi:hypothetical protein